MQLYADGTGEGTSSEEPPGEGNEQVEGLGREGARAAAQ